MPYIISYIHIVHISSLLLLLLPPLLLLLLHCYYWLLHWLLPLTFSPLYTYINIAIHTLSPHIIVAYMPCCCYYYILCHYIHIHTYTYIATYILLHILTHAIIAICCCCHINIAIFVHIFQGHTILHTAMPYYTAILLLLLQSYCYYSFRLAMPYIHMLLLAAYILYCCCYCSYYYTYYQ